MLFQPDTLNMDLYNPGSMDLNSTDSDLVGYVGKIKEFKKPIVSAVREYWDSALSFAAGYLFSGASVAMVAGGLFFDYMSKKNDGNESPVEKYISENITRFPRNTLYFLSGLSFTGTLEPKYVGVGLLLAGAGYVLHRWNKSPGDNPLEDESA